MSSGKQLNSAFDMLQEAATRAKDGIGYTLNALLPLEETKQLLSPDGMQSLTDANIAKNAGDYPLAAELLQRARADMFTTIGENPPLVAKLFLTPDDVDSLKKGEYQTALHNRMEAMKKPDQVLGGHDTQAPPASTMTWPTLNKPAELPDH